MHQVSVARLCEALSDKLALGVSSPGEAGAAYVRRDADDAGALVGHLNLLHPNQIQVLGAHERDHLGGLDPRVAEDMLDRLAATPPAVVILADGITAPPGLAERAAKAGFALWATPRPAAEVIDTLRRHLTKVLAETAERHGVCMDVLGLGVLITGDSGVGKSELALELISRGHGLVADDVVEIQKVSANRLECRCPPMLKDFLEVRGLGVLNIRTIFGETAIRPKMALRLIVHLEKPAPSGAPSIERLPLHELSEDIMGITVRKVVIPVAAGRNLAVLLEAAVRNYILQLRGIFTTREFVERQQAEMLRETQPAIRHDLPPSAVHPSKET